MLVRIEKVIEIYPVEVTFASGIQTFRKALYRAVFFNFRHATEGIFTGIVGT